MCYGEILCSGHVRIFFLLKIFFVIIYTNPYPISSSLPKILPPLQLRDGGAWGVVEEIQQCPPRPLK
jgi:hypothetical protein